MAKYYNASHAFTKSQIVHELEGTSLRPIATTVTLWEGGYRYSSGTISEVLR